MEQAFGVSRAVLREAVEELKRDGFIYSVDRQGLYVSDRPPHLSQFGLVFSNNPSSPEWSRFSRTLLQEAIGLQQERGDITFKSYFDTARGPGSDSYDQLLDDVEAHRLAGLMLMPGAHKLSQIPPFNSKSLPKLYIFGAVDRGRKPSVGTDEMQLCQKMVQWLEKQGRKRIAVVAMWGNTETMAGYLAEHGIPSRPHWLQTVARENLTDVRRVVPLLMDYPVSERPDGLIILDDNLTEHAVGALLDCNLKIGQDIDVVAHCNWPWPVASSSPIQRVGYHARHVLSASLRAIDLLRQGETLATDIVMVPALFEDEVNQPWQAAGFNPVNKE
jgi:DNA-binding LacI/PurR family transcriptional regulator